MGKNDWAVVVGIESYYDASLSGLKGPENDARAFHQWVVSSDGGGVPEAQAHLILSSKFNPPFANVADAMPTAEAISKAFLALREVADKNDEEGEGRQVGDRLYLFFAGHGFAPSHRDDETALLVANASVEEAQLMHVLGPYTANWFWRAAFFKEILLFMDCCRSLMECAQLYEPFRTERAKTFDKVRRFYAYGARVARESRERDFGGGVHRGIFTKTLLDGLGGAASDPRDAKNITAESLRDYLYNAFPDNMNDDDRKKADIPKEPEVVYEQRPGANFVVAPVPAKGVLEKMQAMVGIAPKTPEYPVTIRTAAHAGKTARILDKDLKVIRPELKLEATTQLTLERGMYTVEVPGEAETPFEVTGAGKPVDVDL